MRLSLRVARPRGAWHSSCPPSHFVRADDPLDPRRDGEIRPPEPLGPLTLVGRSRAIAELRRLVAQAAASDVHVLLHGARGTGKELVARAVHAASGRRRGPFVALDCGGLPRLLVESELFGHERGALPGALTRRPGCLALANGGVLFLDRIGHLPFTTQTRLLRALDGGRFRPLGGTDGRTVDVRVVAATPASLEAAAREGRFCPDLLHRLNEVTMVLPALRDRREDLSDLVHHILRRLCAELGKPLVSIDPAALEVLPRYSWPGNVRELVIVLKRAVVLADDRITRHDLPPGVRAAALLARSKSGARLRDTVRVAARTAERTLILRALRDSQGNDARAARLLGIGDRTLRRKLQTYGFLASRRDPKRADGRGPAEGEPGARDCPRRP